MAINALNGVPISTSSNINGVTNPSAVFGISITPPGSPTRIANAIQGSTSVDTGTVTTSSIDTTGANLIVISGSWYTATTAEVTISDSKGNTWTALTGSTGANVRSRLFYCVSPTVGSGHTFTAAGAATFPVIAVEAWGGMSTSSPFDQQTGNLNASASSLGTGSITPTQANTVAFTNCSIVNARSVSSVDSSFTIGNSIADLAANHVGGGIAYRQLSSTSAVGPTWTFSGATACSVRIANFKF